MTRSNSQTQASNGSIPTLENASVSRQSQRGFTLMEMMISIAVFLVFLSGMWINQESFESTTQLNSLTREVALVVRTAQTFGTGSQLNGGGSAQYGVSVGAAPTSTVTLYREEDTDNPDGYDSGDAEAVEVNRLPIQFIISDVCTISSGTADTCSDSAASSVDNRLDVYYQRPSLRTNFIVDGSSASSTQAILEITHRDTGAVERVIIDSTGYISTQ